MRSVLLGVGSHLPERVLTNAELAKRVDTSDEWITERTGIRQRHIAADDEKTSDLACHASVKALKAAGKTADEIDLVLPYRALMADESVKWGAVIRGANIRAD